MQAKGVYLATDGNTSETSFTIEGEVVRGGRLVRRLLPVAVSAGILAALLSAIDPAAVLAALDWQLARVLLPAFGLYGAVSLTLEAVSIRRLIRRAPDDFGIWTAARIKCASYLLGIVHYALGAAALTVLLRRRAAIGLAESASVVMLIAMVDLIVLLGLATTGAAFSDTGTSVIRAGVLAVAALGFFGGLALLRAPASLGPLERVRTLVIFEALRTTPLARLGELLLLRGLFICSFVALAGAAFHAFAIALPASRLVVGILVVAVVSALPIAVSGLGTGQAALVYVFRGLADPETLLALSLVLAAGMISLRAAMGMVFAREFTRQALAESRGAEGL